MGCGHWGSKDRLLRYARSRRCDASKAYDSDPIGFQSKAYLLLEAIFRLVLLSAFCLKGRKEKGDESLISQVRYESEYEY